MDNKQILGGVVAVLAGIVAWKVTDRLLTDAPLEESVFESKWVAVQLGDQTWYAPGTEQTLDIASELDPSMKKLIASLEQKSVRHEGMLSAFTKIAYHPGVELSLDGAVDGALAKMKSRRGVVGVSSNVEPGPVVGLFRANSRQKADGSSRSTSSSFKKIRPFCRRLSCVRVPRRSAKEFRTRYSRINPRSKSAGQNTRPATVTV